jgi:hypothetical protein
MFCPMCGAPNEDDAIFCGNCGAPLELGETGVETRSETSEEQVSEEIPDEEPAEEALGLEALPIAPPPSLPPPPRPPSPMQAVQTSGMAVASLVMGILGWTVLPLIGSILAIVFGYSARNEIRQRPDDLTGEGLAVAGLVLGWLMVGASVLVLCLGSIGACFFLGLVGASGY